MSTIMDDLDGLSNDELRRLVVQACIKNPPFERAVKLIIRGWRRNAKAKIAKPVSERVKTEPMKVQVEPMKAQIVAKYDTRYPKH